MKMQNGFFCQVVSRVLGEATLLALVVLLPITAAQAQHDADNWIFGNNAGFTFFPTTPFTGTPAIHTLEGSSSISDQNGNLLFYTDGTTVWNKTNTQMPSGSGLGGDPSATQSALIVPWPGTACRYYYIFTVDAQENVQTQTLRYSVIDMSLVGGLGDIALPVASNRAVSLKTAVSEKLAAVKDATGSGFWVVAHGYDKPTTAANSEYYAYHIVPNTGLNTTPVVSGPVGSAHDSTIVTTKVPSSGQMKISPDGRLIACAVNMGFVEILNFNSSTGAVTGPPRTFDLSNSPLQDIVSPPSPPPPPSTPFHLVITIPLKQKNG